MKMVFLWNEFENEPSYYRRFEMIWSTIYKKIFWAQIPNELIGGISTHQLETMNWYTYHN